MIEPLQPYYIDHNTQTTHWLHPFGTIEPVRGATNGHVQQRFPDDESLEKEQMSDIVAEIELSAWRLATVD